MNASGTRAYVYCHDGGYPGSAFGIVSVINTSTNSVISTTPLNNVGLPMRMTINPSGTRLFVGLVIGQDHGVTTFDTATKAVDIWGDMQVTGLTTDPFGSYLYVNNAIKGFNVSVLDAYSGQLEATVTSGGGDGIVWHSPTNRLWSEGPCSLKEVNPFTKAVVGTIKLECGISMSRIASHPFIKRIYVPQDFGIGEKGKLAIVDTQLKSVVGYVSTGVNFDQSSPDNVQARGVAIHPKGPRVYVANAAENSVMVINTSNNSVVTTISVGKHPMGMAVKP